MPFFERPCILRDTLEYLSIYLSIEKMVEPLVGNSWLSASQSSRTERRHSVAPYPFRCTTYQTRQYRRICKRSTFPFAWMGKPWWEGIVDGSKWFRLRSSQLASTFIGWNPLSNPRLFFLLPRKDFLLFRNRSEGFIGQNEGLLGWIDLSESVAVARLRQSTHDISRSWAQFRNYGWRLTRAALAHLLHPSRARFVSCASVLTRPDRASTRATRLMNRALFHGAELEGITGGKCN